MCAKEGKGIQQSLTLTASSLIKNTRDVSCATTIKHCFASIGIRPFV